MLNNSKRQYLRFDRLPGGVIRWEVRTLLERNPEMDPSQIEDVLLGCANQAGEDNRNVARMALLLAGLPETVPGASLNRLCGSGMDAVACASTDRHPLFSPYRR